MPKIKKPLREKRPTAKSFGRVPGTRDRNVIPRQRDRNAIQQQQDIDQKASSRFLHDAALKRKGKKPQSGKTKPKARAAKPKSRSKRRGA